MRRLLLRSVLSLVPLALIACAPAAAPKGEADARTAAAPGTAAAATATTTGGAPAPAKALQPVAPGGKRVELVNNSRHGTLLRLEIAPVEDRETFREVVSARGLPDGDERDVRWGKGCAYDTRAVMEDGVTLINFRVDVCFRNRIFLGDWPGQNQKPWDGAPGATAPAPQ